ncbi:hypothetical protein ACTU6U_11195 [Microbacterium sp. A196]|uniref:hypothetical protein n=1 Tax=Microbacterium sp. A196 TaxID=3457320 RepID=UPI003FD55D86
MTTTHPYKTAVQLLAEHNPDHVQARLLETKQRRNRAEAAFEGAKHSAMETFIYVPGSVAGEGPFAGLKPGELELLRAARVERAQQAWVEYLDATSDFDFCKANYA